MRVKFWKMHGAGNDFILIDDRSGLFHGSLNSAFIERMCARRTGIGADGLILIRPSSSEDFAVLFFNADGSEAEMCGNGARCAARLANQIGAAPRKMSIETRSGRLCAEMTGDAVRLHMNPPREWHSMPLLHIGRDRIACEFINTGVPHAVIETSNLEHVDVQKLGALIRSHKSFAPEGTNVDFMTVCAPGMLRIRTYERGVEAETAACGTGAIACALVAARAGSIAPPVLVACASGESLEVNFMITDDGAKDVALLGPARHVFRGELECDG